MRRIKVPKSLRAAATRQVASPWVPEWVFTIKRPDAAFRAHQRARLAQYPEFGKLLQEGFKGQAIADASVSRKVEAGERDRMKSEVVERRMGAGLEGVDLPLEKIAEARIDRAGALMLIERIDGVAGGYEDDETGEAGEFESTDKGFHEAVLAMDDATTGAEYVDGEGDDELKIVAGEELGIAHTLWVLYEAEKGAEFREAAVEGAAKN